MLQPPSYQAMTHHPRRVLYHGHSQAQGKGIIYMPGAAGHVKTMAMDSWAHLVLMAALERVDDTALLRKHIVAELMVRFLSQHPPLPAIPSGP